MPEATDLLVRGGQMTSGFWIPRVAVVQARQTRLVRAEDNKENEPPAGLGGYTPWRRRQRTRKILLREWHPRTRLRDITTIINESSLLRRVSYQTGWHFHNPVEQERRKGERFSAANRKKMLSRSSLSNTL